MCLGSGTKNMLEIEQILNFFYLTLPFQPLFGLSPPHRGHAAVEISQFPVWREKRIKVEKVTFLKSFYTLV